MEDNKMKGLGNHLNYFIKDERGGVFILVALLIVFVLLGSAALAVDGGALYVARREVVNAADAAALAGAQELAIGSGNAAIKQQASNYAVLNGAEEIGDSDIFITSNTVKVNTFKEVNLTLARFLGLESLPVSATATAYIGPFQVFKGLIPIALKSSEITAADGSVIIDFHTLGPGNWGVVSFSGPGADNNPNNVANYIENGYPYPVPVGCPVTATNTGAAVACKQKTVDDALESIVGEEVYVPIISNEYEPGSKNVDIIGFAKGKVRSYDQKNCTLIVELLEVLDVSELNPDQTAANYGLVGVALIE